MFILFPVVQLKNSMWYQVHETLFIVSLWTVAPTNFICVSVSVFVYVSVCLSCVYSLYLAYNRLDFDQTWWKCWNFGPIDCIKIS